MSKIIDALLCDIDKNIKHIQDKIHIYGKIKDNYDKIDGREYDKFMQNFKHPFYITIIDNGRVINVDEDDECDSIYSKLDMSKNSHLNEVRLDGHFNFLNIFIRDSDGFYTKCFMETKNIFVINQLLKYRDYDDELFESMKDFTNNISLLYKNFRSKNNKTINDLNTIIHSYKNKSTIFEYSTKYYTKQLKYIELINVIIQHNNIDAIDSDNMNKIINNIDRELYDKLSGLYLESNIEKKCIFKYLLKEVCLCINTLNIEIKNLVNKYNDTYYNSRFNKLRLGLTDECKHSGGQSYYVDKQDVDKFWSDYIAYHFDIFIDYNVIKSIQSIYPNVNDENIKEYCEEILFNALGKKLNIFELVFYANKLLVF